MDHDTVLTVYHSFKCRPDHLFLMDDIIRQILTPQMQVPCTNERYVLVIAIPADVLAPNGTRPSANAVMDMKSGMFSCTISSESWFLFSKYRLPDYDITSTIYLEKYCVSVRKNIIPFIYLLLATKILWRKPDRQFQVIRREQFILIMLLDELIAPKTSRR